ncbi:cytochrome b561 [Skermanella aerolata]|uniref:Cytochrome b561 n=1 Tax=Skermanella aerolata TaxID=393310 RepID=A0A512DKX8_9PROT|nr:cytochrome b/b6 domain-containing protein [Skermanella aerolata]GEO37134.1 cytochrome b561 [Skermanella aerolata]
MNAAEGSVSGGPGSAGSVSVWDPVVRIFHWTVVAGCLANLFIVEDGGRAHEVIGYAVAAVLVVRLVWGFVGTRYARFSDFVPGPRRLAEYLTLMAQGREPRQVGHNPAAAVMMVVLMALLAAVSITGWMATLDAFWGVEWVEELHEVTADAILWLALIHAGAALYESMRHRENLVWAMVTGRKRA